MTDQERERQLIEKINRTWESMKEVMDTAAAEGRDLTGEENEKYSRGEADLDTFEKELDRIKRHAERAHRLEQVEHDPIVNPGGERSDDRDEQYREAFIAYARGGMESLEPEQRLALRSGFVREERAQAVGTDTAGGYLVPEGFRAEIVRAMLDYGAVERVAQVITTTTGNTLPWPTVDDTAQVGALLAENTQVAEQDVTIGTDDLGAYKYTSKLVRVSLEFMQDVDWVDTEAFLAGIFAERIGRITNQHFTTGTGTAQPDGIVTSAVSGVTAASATTITMDELIQLQHSVDPAYRRSPRVRWMFDDAVLSATRRLKDADNNYLWQPNNQVGQAPTLLGYPYEINNDMAAPAAGVKSVLFGDFFRGYVIRRVRGVQMIRMNERYADFFQVGFVSFMRTDGTAQDTGAYRALTQAAV